MFDVLEARTNRVVMAKLANAIAVIRGVDVPVIFDATYKQGQIGPIGMGGESPQMVMSSGAVPADFVGDVIVIRGQSWEVADRQPDSETDTGLTVIPLVKL